MAGIIVISQVITATDADILNGTRLQTVPANGVLTIELIADLNNATNNFAVTIQLPNGDAPLESVPVPADAGS